jgi:hypothetical protein
MHREIQLALSDADREDKFTSISTPAYKRLKERLYIIDQILCSPALEHNEAMIPNFIKAALEADDIKKLAKMVAKQDGELSTLGWMGWVASGIGKMLGGSDQLEGKLADLRTHAKNLPDVVFLQELPLIVDRQPLLFDAATRVNQSAREHLLQAIAHRKKSLVARIEQIQEKESKKRYTAEAQAMRISELADARQSFIQDTQVLLQNDVNECVPWDICSEA